MHVELAETLRPDPGHSEWARRAHQPVLDLIGVERPVGVEEQSGGSGHDAGRERGARALQVAGGDLGRGVGEIDRRLGRAGRHHVGARCHQVGLGEPVGGGRADGRERGDGVVPPGCGRVVVGGADRDHQGVVGRLGDRPRGGAVVAGGHHDDDAGVPHPLHGEVERVDLVALGGVGAEGQVQHPDAVGVLEGHHPLEGGEHLDNIGEPVAPGDLHRHDPGAGRLALHRPVEAGAVAGDQAGDEGAVAVVVLVVLLGGEVLRVHDLAGQVPGGVDPGVDHRDVDALAGEAVAPGLGRLRHVRVDGAGHPALLAVEALHPHGGVGADRPDAWQPAEQRDRRRRYPGAEAVDDPQLLVHRPAQAADRLFGSVVERAQLLHDDRHRRPGRGGLGPHRGAADDHQEAQAQRDPLARPLRDRHRPSQAAHPRSVPFQATEMWCLSVGAVLGGLDGPIGLFAHHRRGLTLLARSG